MSTYYIIAIIAILVAFFLLKSVFGFFRMIVSLAIAGGVFVYFMLGRPEYQDQPFELVQKNQEKLEKMSPEQLISEYEKSLEQYDDANKRSALAGILTRLGQFDKAREHFSKAFELDKNNNPDITLSYAETLIASGKQKITSQAYGLIEQALSKDSDNPRGLFYQGLYYAQTGKTTQAKTVWKKLVSLSDEQPWQTIAYQNLEQVIGKFGITANDLSMKPRAKSDQKISKEDLPMIRQMVQRLDQKVKDNPQDQSLKIKQKQMHEQLINIEEKFKN